MQLALHYLSVGKSNHGPVSKWACDLSMTAFQCFPLIFVQGPGFRLWAGYSLELEIIDSNQFGR